MSYSRKESDLLWHVLDGKKGLRALEQGEVKIRSGFKALQYCGSVTTPHVGNLDSLLETMFTRENVGLYLLSNFHSASEVFQYEGRILNYFHAKENQRISSILKDVGNPIENIETIISYIALLMSGQMNGESGALLVNGCENFFFAENKQAQVLMIGLLWQSFMSSKPNGWKFTYQHCVDHNTIDFIVGSKYRIFIPLPILF